MSFVAAAIIGSAVVGGVLSYTSAEKAGKSAEKGAQRSADATIQSTTMQIDELKRQYDYQQQVLLPQIQQQYNAQRAYSDLLGIGGPGAQAPGGGPPAERRFNIPGRTQVGPDAGGAPPVDQARLAELQEQLRNAEYQTTAGTGGAGTMRRRADARQQADYLRQQISDIENPRLDALAGPGAQMGAPGSSGLADRTGARFDPATGAFVDPNLDPTRLRDVEELSGQVRGNLLAGTTAGEDPYRQYIEGNRIAAATPEESLMVQRTGDVLAAEGAAGTGVYGDVFEESPGYAFQIEEMQRELDRAGSAGGKYGGRAIIEAQRRAQGEAAGEYYNWASGRERDLGRLGQAEAFDIGRGDQAYQGYETQRIQDVQRQDRGYEDYLRRREGDAARLDAATAQRDRYAGVDRQRQDQAYYNYLNNLQTQAGFGGGPAATAVQAAGAQGGAVAGAYRGQGSQLATTYANQGISQANVDYAQGAGVNQALQGGAANWLTAGQAGMLPAWAS
jgi:hypothetical protein